MEYRCDKVFQCEDQSDEESCKSFKIDTSTYSKINPPIDKEMKLAVNVSMVIEKIDNVKELEMSLDAKFLLKLEWYDSRLSYKNLLDNDHTNLLNDEHRNQIWTPSLVLSNTADNTIMANGPRSVLFIKKQGHYNKSPLSSINEDYYYHGSQNMLVLEGTYQVTLQCHFELAAYPLDTQMCNIEVNQLGIANKIISIS